MRSQDPARPTLQVQGHSQRQMQAAWRQIDGTKDGGRKDEISG
jgi:hypothetical protein